MSDRYSSPGNDDPPLDEHVVRSPEAEREFQKKQVRKLVWNAHYVLGGFITWVALLLLFAFNLPGSGGVIALLLIGFLAFFFLNLRGLSLLRVAFLRPLSVGKVYGVIIHLLLLLALLSTIVRGFLLAL